MKKARATRKPKESRYEAPDGARIVCLNVYDAVVPREISRFTTAYGGVNLYGDPNFRIIWGSRRRWWRVSLWHDRDANGALLRRVKEPRYYFKYPKFKDNFILEYWKPPTWFGGGDKRLWRRERGYSDAMVGRIDQPEDAFPSRGDYEFADFYGGDDGGPLEIQGVKHSIDRVRALLTMPREVFEAKKAAEKVQEEREIFNHYLSMVKDATRPTTHSPWLSMTGPRFQSAGGSA